MVYSHTPKKSVQDGEKSYFLCSECEEQFSKYEKYFSEKVYEKLKNDNRVIQLSCDQKKIRYFVLSMAWRILKYSLEDDSKLHLKNHLSPKEMDYLNNVEIKWAGWLRDEDEKQMRTVQMFLIPTTEYFEDKLERRTYSNVGYDFCATGEKDNSKYAYIIIQVPYMLFVITVWGKTEKMKGYLLGKKSEITLGQLPNFIDEHLHRLHVTRFNEINAEMTDEHRADIVRRVEKSNKTINGL